MKFLFLIDPPSSLHPEKDTSLALMAAAKERGEVYYTTWGGFHLENSEIYFAAQKITVNLDGKKAVFVLGEKELLCAQELDVFFIRTDPPFDLNYLVHCWLLDYLPPHVAVINEPRALSLFNEKIFALRFRSLIPDTVITKDKKVFQNFLDKHKTIVAKSIHGFGGSQVFLVHHRDLNRHVIFETLAQKGEYVLLQEYIPQASEGDKRILILGQRILGCILRVHAEGDHRNNFAAGGKAFPCELTKRDQEIVDQVSQVIFPMGIHFAGLDILGSYLTEINVTSPTCLREMNLLYGVSLEKEVIDYAIKLSQDRKRQYGPL